MPAPALGAAGCSVPARRAKGAPSAGHVRFLFFPRAREGAQGQQRLSHSRRNSICQGGAGGTSQQTGSRERNKLRYPGMDQTQVKQMNSGSFVGLLNENKIHFRSDLSNQSVLLC